uniref:Uncharacterized protein LOC114332298 n=1 Tax=Diabrotica virgifera virgifera TaxID=50390 RepID=A0A6P7FYI9_DIAVI
MDVCEQCGSSLKSQYGSTTSLYRSKAATNSQSWWCFGFCNTKESTVILNSELSSVSDQSIDGVYNTRKTIQFDLDAMVNNGIIPKVTTKPVGSSILKTREYKVTTILQMF